MAASFQITQKPLFNMWHLSISTKCGVSRNWHVHRGGIAHPTRVDFRSPVTGSAEPHLAGRSSRAQERSGFDVKVLR